VSVADWCILGAVMLYLLTVAPAKALGHREFDNAVPRDAAFYDHPVRKRVLGAHLNGIEAFPCFAAAVLLAEFRHAPQEWVDALAVAFLITRAAFVLAYVTDKPLLRTALCNVGFGFNLGIFLLPAFGSKGAALAVMGSVFWAATVWLLLSRLGPRRSVLN
jgi:uncharacterized MAPEG superfamily protein